MSELSRVLELFAVICAIVSIVILRDREFAMLLLAWAILIKLNRMEGAHEDHS